MAPPKSARTRSADTKLTEEEYARLEASVAKSGLTVGEWCRMELLRGAGAAVGDGNGNATIRDAIPIPAPIARPATSTDETLLAEGLALRTILLNLFYDLANGENVTATRMQELIAKADGKKKRKLWPGSSLISSRGPHDDNVDDIAAAEGMAGARVSIANAGDFSRRDDHDSGLDLPAEIRVDGDLFDHEVHSK